MRGLLRARKVASGASTNRKCPVFIGQNVTRKARVGRVQWYDTFLKNGGWTESQTIFVLISLLHVSP